MNRRGLIFVKAESQDRNILAKKVGQLPPEI
jgi:hypothetical protein